MAAAPNTAKSLSPPDQAGQNVRVTLNLNARSRDDLEWLVEKKGYSKTDLINRAIQIYALIEQLSADGNRIMIRCQDGSTQVLKIV